MKLKNVIPLILHVTPSEMTESARCSLTSILQSLNHLTDISPEGHYGSSQDYNRLLDQLVDLHLADYTATFSPESVDAALAAAPHLLRAMKAAWAKHILLFDDQRDHLLDLAFECLDTALDAPVVTSDVAALILQLLSECTIEDGADAPYIDALCRYIDSALPTLETDLLPVPGASATPAILLRHAEALSLIFQSGFLVQDRYRLRALPLYDTLRRHLLHLLTDGTPPVASLAIASSYLLHADTEAGPVAYDTLLATLAQTGLDTSDRLSDDWWHYLSVYATATLDHEFARQNQSYDNPFE